MLAAFVESLAPSRLTHVADIGANPIDADQPYSELLQARLCRLTGFEPQVPALEKLQASASDLQTYLPYAIGDGGAHTLNICNYSGWSSLLTPSERALQTFPFKRNAAIVDRVPVQTHRLDDLAEARSIDFLKIDVQGSELPIFENGRDALRETVAIQVEVSFVALYENQPVWSSIDLELRAQGFIPLLLLHTKPHFFSKINGQPVGERHQMLEADAVYVRDYQDPEKMTAEQLKHLAIILHSCVEAYDTVFHIMNLLKARRELSETDMSEYAKSLVRTGKVKTQPEAQSTAKPA